MQEEKVDKKRVFISYGHDNCKDLAFLLNDRLKEKGYDPWIDKDKLKLGDEWELFMEDGLIKSDSILALMTPYSMRRPDGFCLNEIAMANFLHKTIIPIMVRKAIPPLSIVRLQWLDFQEWPFFSDDIFNNKFEKILEVVDGKELRFEGEYTYLLQKLKPMDFGVEIDKHIRNFFGRKWVFQEVKNWLYGKEEKESKIFLLIGEPGIGKTAIASKICREFSEVAAYHLIEYGNFIKSDAKECVLSLAYQLSNQIPDLVNSLMADGLENLDKENALSLFDRLIVQPLRRISEPEKPKLIVIDALDEAKKEKRSGKGMENEMVDFIAKIFELTPKWLKLFITSRPEQYILNKLSELEHFSLNTKNERNDEDIRGFLKEELKKIFPNSPIDNAINTIVERSEGIFLYVIKILEDLETDPKQGILKIQNPDKFPKGLTGWYLENFERQFPDKESYEKYLRPLFELIVSAQEPIKLSMIRKILDWNAYELKEVLRSIGSLFKITSDREIEPFHKTLIEWLIDEKATEAADRTFFIDENSGDKKFANFGLNIYKSDHAQLPFYFFRHLVHHLSMTDKIDEFITLKIELKIDDEKLNISEIASQFILHLTQYFKKENRDDILKEFLLDSKKVSCPECKGINIKYKKSINLYECLNPECRLQFDTKIHAKFKRIFLSHSPRENLLDLIEQVKHDLEEDYHSIEKTWEEAQVVLIFLSPQSISEEKCLLDIKNARRYDKKIISILIEDCVPSGEFSLPRIIPLDFKNWPFTDLEYKAKLNQLKYKIEEEIIISETPRLKNAYISFDSGAKYKIIEELDDALKMLGVNTFINDGVMSQEACINYLKKSDLVIFFIFPYYGTLIEVCHLKEECIADCPMKTGKGKISYTHCEYKNAKTEGLQHMVYLIKEGWKEIWDLKDLPQNEIKLIELKKIPFFEKMDDDLIKHYIDIRMEACIFKEEIDKKYWKGIENIEDPNMGVDIVKELVGKIIGWYFAGSFDLPNFSSRREELRELIENIDGKVEVWGVGGVGKTTLVQVALLFEKLRGRDIITIGTAKSYASGSGYETFRRKCRDFQYILESRNEITLYDVINAFAESGLLPKVGEVIKLPKDQQIEILAKIIEKEKNLILFIDDFHLATHDVIVLIKALDRVIYASRKNTYLARKEIYLGGIDELDRENLLDLMLTRSNENIPNWVKDKIIQISEGHPITMELLVRNYQLIDFDKFKDFEPDNVDGYQLEDFLKRVIEDSFSDNPKALNLLRDLSIINAKIDTNIHRESVERSYDVMNFKKIFIDLLNDGMLKKKEGKEGVYEFAFKHIQSALKSSANQKSHERAIKYYQRKKENIGENINDAVENLFHKVKLYPSEILINEFIEVKNKLLPIHYGFKRLIDVGNELEELLENRDKTLILHILGDFYLILNKFEKAERMYIKALEIRKKLAEKSPDIYLPDVAHTQHKLGILYKKLRRFSDSENAYNETLKIRKKLAEKSPNEYLFYFAQYQLNHGDLFRDLLRFEEARMAYTEALRIYMELSEKNLETYLPNIAMTKNRFGLLYRDLKRFDEAQKAYSDALTIYRNLIKKNPDIYLFYLAETLNNLGVLYRDLKMFKNAEEFLLEALKLRKELVEKNPDAFLFYLTETQNSLGVLYRELKRFKDAEEFLLEALELRKELADKNPDAYMFYIAETQNNCGRLYQNIKRFEEAEHAFEEALEIRKELADKNPDVYNPAVATVWYNKACLESRRNNKVKSVEFLKKAIDLDKKYVCMAKIDVNFVNIRDSNDFKELIDE